MYNRILSMVSLHMYIEIEIAMHGTKVIENLILLIG